MIRFGENLSPEVTGIAALSSLRCREIIEVVSKPQIAPKVKAWTDASVRSLLKRGVFSEALALERKDDEFLAIADDIKRFNLFSHLTQDELQDIASHLIYKRFARGQTLFHKGDISNRMYFIAKGEITAINPSMHLRATESMGLGTGVGGQAFLTGCRHGD